MVNEMMQNNGNPKELLKQIMNSSTPEQKQLLFSKAKTYGVPNNVLAELQNMK